MRGGRPNALSPAQPLGREKESTPDFLLCFFFSLQDGSLLSSPFFKGFLAGYVVAKLRASAVLGFAVGTCTGIYAAQAYAVPNVEKTLKNYFRSLRKGPD